MKEKEIKKIFSYAKEKIKPSEKLSQSILANLDIAQVNKKLPQTFKTNKTKGRISFNGLNFNQIHNLMTNWKVVVPVILVVLVAAGLLVVSFSQKPMPQRQAEQPKTVVEIPQEVPVPQATGNIDDAVGAMVAMAENEQAITFDELNDILMIDLDSQAIGDFGQSYDENQF